MTDFGRAVLFALLGSAIVGLWAVTIRLETIAFSLERIAEVLAP